MRTLVQTAQHLGELGRGFGMPDNEGKFGSMSSVMNGSKLSLAETGLEVSLSLLVYCSKSAFEGCQIDSHEASGLLFIHRAISAIWALSKHYLHIFNFNETSIRAWQLMLGRNNELDSVLFVCLCLCSY
ncbi:uncharacterized protein LJ206_009459 isoform 1-T1 [Theristicus caerulescens]